jgi:tetratricopeptide (TPR) repeat protein
VTVSERLTKKQLKEDPLLKTTGETLDFAKHHVRLLFGIVGAGLLVVAIVVFSRNASSQSAERAAGIMAAAQSELSRGSLEPAAARLQEVITNMGGTPAGKQAYLVLADVRYNQGRFQEAADVYEAALEAVGDDPILGGTVRRGLAACRENLGQPAAAAALYQELADATESFALRAELLMAAARNYVKAGRVDAARTVYQELAENPENTRIATDAALRLAELGG